MAPSPPSIHHVGQWFESAEGVLVMPRVIDLAMNYGYVVPEDDRVDIAQVEQGDNDEDLIEHVIFIADSAVKFLNKTVIRDPRIAFGWHEGDLYLWPMTWWRNKLAG